MNKLPRHFCQLLRYQCKSSGGTAAFRFLNRTGDTAHILTFDDLDSRAKCIAAYLQNSTEPGDRVIVALPPSPEYISILFGCFYAGLIAVPYYPPRIENFESGYQSICKIVQSSQANHLVTTPAVRDLINNTSEYPVDSTSSVAILTDKLLMQQHGEVWDDRRIDGQDIALLLYTSGSTGEPKGAIISHSSFIYNMIAFSEHCNRGVHDRICTWLPNCHIAGLYTRLLGTVLGVEAIIFSPQFFMEEPDLWLKILSDFRITFTAAPNFAYDLCSGNSEKNLEGLDLSGWEMAVTGGEVVRQDIYDRFSERLMDKGFDRSAFRPYYGLTETLCTSVAGDNRPPRILKVSRKSLNGSRINLEPENGVDTLCLLSNGSTFGDTRLEIVDPETLRICGEKEVGEIWVSGSSITSGYWGNPELTDEICRAYLPALNGKRFFRTGDLGFIDNDEVFVTGRLKELIIIRGKNYYPQDIEFVVLASLPRTASACAAFAYEDRGSESLGVVIECANSVVFSDKQALALDIKSQISQSCGVRVGAVVILDHEKIPRTPTQKIQRGRCRQMYVSGDWQAVGGESVSDSQSKGISEDITTSAARAALTGGDQFLLERFLCQELHTVSGLSVSDIRIEVPLSSLGLDSVLTVKWIYLIKQKLGIAIPADVFFDESTLSDIAGRIADGRLTSDVAEHRINYGPVIERVCSIIRTGTKKRGAAVKRIFLTGATGFLGGYLLRDLLERTEYEIHCLVRARNERDGHDRLINRICSLSTSGSRDASRIIPIIGDLGTERFGLATATFDRLCEDVDMVYHNGANVNFVSPYGFLEKTNVTSLEDIFSLASKNHLKPVHFVSTTAVFNSHERDQYSVLSEELRLANPDNLFSGYAQTKWVAEKICDVARRSGVPVTCYRPALVTGDSKSGFCHTEDFLCRFIKGCLQLGVFPDVDMEMDMVPVDFVSRALVHLSLESEAEGKTFHLANPSPIKLKEMVEVYIREGFSADYLPLEQWFSYVHENIIESNALYPVLPFLCERHPVNDRTILDIYHGKRLALDFENVLKLLSGSGITCPLIDKKLLNTYIHYFIDTGYLMLELNPEIGHNGSRGRSPSSLKI